MTIMNISVVIPAYNEEKYISETLISLQAQRRKPDEVIVVDGNSTDRTRRIAQSHKARVIVVKRRGIGLARQKGLEAAKGNIVACTDADTVLPDNWLSIIEEELSHGDAVGVYGNFRISSGPVWYRFYVNRLQPYVFRIAAALSIPIAAGQNIAFIRNEAVKAGGFPVDYKMVEDNELARRLKTQGVVRYRKDMVVISSGRRGYEGIALPLRYAVAFFFYFLFKRGDIVGFRDFR